MNLHSTVLFVRDIEKSKVFYTTVMKQEVTMDFGLNITFNGGLAIWQIRDSHPLHKRLHNADSNAFELYFEEQDIHRFAHVLKAQNVPLFHDVQEEPWGQRTIRFYDPDAHLIEVGEPLEVFLQRMYDEGMTMEAIHHKTGVPHEQLKETICL